MSKNDMGFSAVDVILIVAAAALIIGVGYSVYKNNFKTTTPVNKVATNTYAPGKSIQRPTVSNGLIKLPELGIELVNVPSSIIDLTYYESYVGSEVKNNALQFSTASLTKIDHFCSAKTDAIGALGRSSGTFDSNTMGGVYAVVKQFNGFYIEYYHPEYCWFGNSHTPAAESLMESQTTTLEAFVMNPANIQLIQ